MPTAPTGLAVATRRGAVTLPATRIGLAITTGAALLSSMAFLIGLVVQLDDQGGVPVH
jgi:hypothetical protein